MCSSLYPPLYPPCSRDLCAAIPTQVTSPVQWEQTMNDLFAKGLSSSYEIGPGKVVAGIAKRINKAHEITNIVA